MYDYLNLYYASFLLLYQALKMSCGYDLKCQPKYKNQEHKCNEDPNKSKSVVYTITLLIFLLFTERPILLSYYILDFVSVTVSNLYIITRNF